MITSKKHRPVFILAGLLILSFIMGIPGCSSLSIGQYEEIPELKRLEDLNATSYYGSAACFDGKKLTYAHSSFSLMPQKNEASLVPVKQLITLKGKKAEDWTKDKIKYPIYAVTLMPIVMDSKTYIPGETVVWTNGYLITTSGNVYKCKPDFKPFFKEDGHAKISVNDMESIIEPRIFRPLSYANGKWNKDLLRKSSSLEEKKADDIEAVVTGIENKAVLPVVSVTLKNNGSSHWNYTLKGLSVRVEVSVDGEWYYLHYAPNIDLTYSNILEYNEVVLAGHEDHKDIYVGQYSLLPAGDYRIIISGKDNSYVCAEYHID